MKEGDYFKLTIRTAGQRTPWSKHSIDFFPYVAGDVTENFDTLEQLQAYLDERYKGLTGKKTKRTQHSHGEGKTETYVEFRHWVTEKPDIYHSNVTPMKFYKTERIWVEEVHHSRKYLPPVLNVKK